MYMYKEDLALNNLQWLICHKSQLNQIPLQYLALFKKMNFSAVHTSFIQILKFHSLYFSNTHFIFPSLLLRFLIMINSFIFLIFIISLFFQNSWSLPLPPNMHKWENYCLNCRWVIHKSSKLLYHTDGMAKNWLTAPPPTKKCVESHLHCHCS